MRITGILLLCLCLFAACSEKHEYKGKIPLVEVGGEVLFKEELTAVLPPNLSKEDSLLFAENYILNWVEDVLMYQLAEINIPDNDHINRLTENYRKALIVHTYQQALIAQSLAAGIDEEDILDYYTQNTFLFRVEEPLIKGLFIKVPLSSPGLNDVRRWYKKNTPENTEALEKYSLNKAVSYDYFYDKWTPASSVLEQIVPLDVEDIETYLSANRQVEIRDEEYVYFLNVDQLLIGGEQKPFEFAQKEIKEILANMKKVTFINEVKRELYRNAVSGKNIRYHY